MPAYENTRIPILGMLLLLNTFCPLRADNKGDHLPPGARMESARTDILASKDGRFSFIMQKDCNLVIQKGRYVLWASNTKGRAAVCYAEMQSDGNFVLYDAGRKALWSSGTNRHPNSSLVLQDDGNLVIYSGNQSLWNSNTKVQEPTGIRRLPGPQDSLSVGFSLDGNSNDYLQSGPSVFKMQSDCNLVLYVNNGARWSSKTNGRGPDCRAIMQNDGNLVVYRGNGQAVWSSNTAGHVHGLLVLQLDQNVVVYDRPPSSKYETVLWATGTNIRPASTNTHASKDPFPGCVPEKTNTSCYGVMICHDVYVCPGLGSNLQHPEKTGDAYPCGVCFPTKIKF